MIILKGTAKENIVSILGLNRTSPQQLYRIKISHVLLNPVFWNSGFHLCADTSFCSFTFTHRTMSSQEVQSGTVPTVSHCALHGH